MQITKIVTSATNNISNAELHLVEDEIKKSVKHPTKYQKETPDNVKQEVDIYINSFGTASVIKKFELKYGKKYSFNRTTINSWNLKYKDGANNVTFKKVGRPNLLDDNLIKKVKAIAFRTRSAGGVINRKQILNIANGVEKTNNPNSLKGFGGKLELTDRWARYLLNTMGWKKRKGTTGKVEPSSRFLF